MDTPKPPTGQAIRHALKEELTINLYPLPFTTLVPAIYHVYMHPDDYEAIEGIVPRVIAEIATALTKDVERLNQVNQESDRRGGSFRNLLRQHETMPPIEVPPNGWEIFIQADQDEELPRGALGIESKLMMPARPEYGGTPTVRTVKTVFTEGRRATSSASVSDVPSPAASDAPPRASTTRQAPTTRPAPTPRATLSYQDDDRHHVFLMRKDLIKIGRGGSDAWVDVQLITTPKVSREHCWIRHDADGRFFIRDASTWGTSVNGQLIPVPVRSPDGLVVEPGAETELPGEARIELADALVIQFRAELQR